MTAPVVQRICPVCVEGKSAEYLRKGDLRLVRCACCAMVYADPVPESFISGVFYIELAEGFYLSPDKLESDYAPVRFAREIRLLRAFCQRGKILDVGCSTGGFLFQLQRRFPGDYETLGVDVAEPALNYASEKGVPVRQGSFLTMDFREKFSAVTFWATLEHVIDPARYLAKAASVLQPGGRCFILVPNFRSLATRLLGARYRYILPQHVNYFASATLRELARREKTLRMAYIGSMHFNPLVLWQDWRNDIPASDADRIRLLKRTTGYKQNPALKPLRWAVGVIERALGAAALADNLVTVLEKY